jgi:hypothetical protein
MTPHSLTKPHSQRPWLRLGGIVIVIAFALAATGVGLGRAQRKAVSAIERAGGAVRYDRLGRVISVEFDGTAKSKPQDSLAVHIARLHSLEELDFFKIDPTRLRAVVTDLVTLFTLAPSQGAEVSKAMLGTAAGKVVISDRFKGYLWVRQALAAALPIIGHLWDRRLDMLQEPTKMKKCVTGPRVTTKTMITLVAVVAIVANRVVRWIRSPLLD